MGIKRMIWEPLDNSFDHYWLEHGLKRGDLVTVLGEIENAPGHLVIINTKNQIVQMVHDDNLREPTAGGK